MPSSEAVLTSAMSSATAATRSVDHSAVVKVFDFVESGPHGPLPVMEYFPGRDL
jgi:hypothetical protein